MLSGLMLTAFLMGLGGIPHCATMCGAPCALAFPQGVPLLSLIGRCVGYTVLGAVAAASAGAIAVWGRQFAFLQPFWVMLLAVTLVVGLYLMASGRMPPRIDEWGQQLYRRLRARWGAAGGEASSPTARAWVTMLAGMAWVVMPCGLLYAALMVAALAPDAWGGAAVMFAFAIPGAFGVWAAPYVLREAARLLRFARPAEAAGAISNQVVPIVWMKPDAMPTRTADQPMRPLGPDDARPVTAITANQFDPRWAIRLSGLMLACMTGWALYHQVLDQWRAWCA